MTNAITVRDKRIAFGHHRVLDGVSLEVAEGRIVGLIGPSGAGKSVLLKSIAGVLDAPHIEQSGLVEVSGTCSLMFQEGALFDSLSVFDNLAFPLVHGRVPAQNLLEPEREAVRSAVATILARVGLVRAAWKYPAQLSGGMRRRISLARALIGNPRVVLLDDPTAGLDPVASSVIMELIRELHREQQLTTVIVSHDLRRLLPMVDTIVAMDHGTVTFAGTLSELLQTTNQRLRAFVSCRYDLHASPEKPTQRSESRGVV